MFLLLILLVPQTEGHILGGSEIEVNGVIFQFITDPAFVVEDEDFYLSFSVQDAVTDIGLENIQVVITFFEDSGRVYDIIEVPGNEIIEGDFSIKYNLKNEGIYDVKIDVTRESGPPLDTQFRILVSNKSILEDSSFIIGIAVSLIVIGLIVKNRVIDRQKEFNEWKKTNSVRQEISGL